MTEFTFSTATEAPAAASRRGRNVSPFEAPFLRTLDNDQEPWSTVTVPADQVDKVRQRVRAVAYKHGYGSTIRVVDHGDDTATVYFQARDKRTRHATVEQLETASVEGEKAAKATTTRRKTNKATK